MASGLALIVGATAFMLGGSWSHTREGASAFAPQETVAQIRPAAPTRGPIATSTSTVVPMPTASLAEAAQNWAVIAHMLALTPTALPPAPSSSPQRVSAPPPASQPVVPTATPVPQQQAPTPPPATPTPTSCPTATMAGFALQLFNDINGQRTQNGVPALAADDCVTYVAQERSTDMATRNYFSHSSPEGTGAFDMLTANGVLYGWAGENLARNNYPDDQTVDVAIRDLMASQGHRDNMLSTNYTAMGVAAVNDGTGMWYFTMVFIGPP